jgi:hypothetical protein
MYLITSRKWPELAGTGSGLIKLYLEKRNDRDAKCRNACKSRNTHQCYGYLSISLSLYGYHLQSTNIIYPLGLGKNPYMLIEIKKKRLAVRKIL